ncbi:MAG TPA: ABC transporter permease [Dehalococcoidia bacterium]|nr:ABC transporter permease [Dehalococcoidia bacterium]
MDLIWEGLREAARLLARGDDAVYSTAARSLYVSGLATLLSLAGGVWLGTFLAYQRFPGRALALTLVNTGMGLPPVAVGLVVAIILWRSGPLGRLELIYTPWAMVIAQMVLTLPIVTGFTAAALQAQKPGLRLQLYGIGASRLQALWILLKEARLPIVAAVMAAFGAAISEVGASMMVGGNIAGETRVLTTAVVLETSRGEFGPAIALSVILVGLVFLVNLVLTSVQLREG